MQLSFSIINISTCVDTEGLIIDKCLKTIDNDTQIIDEDRAREKEIIYVVKVYCKNHGFMLMSN